VLCQAIIDEIADGLPKLENQLAARYVLIRYLLLYIIREVMEHDSVGKEAIANPAKFVREKSTREKFKTCIRTIVEDLIIDLNGEIAEYGEDFDYRDRLRDAAWVRELRRTLVAGYLKQVQRKRIASIGEEWDRLTAA
jgi:hypothetical protein